MAERATKHLVAKQPRRKITIHLGRDPPAAWEKSFLEEDSQVTWKKSHIREEPHIPQQKRSSGQEPLATKNKSHLEKEPLTTSNQDHSGGEPFAARKDHLEEELLATKRKSHLVEESLSPRKSNHEKDSLAITINQPPSRRIATSPCVNELTSTLEKSHLGEEVEMTWENDLPSKGKSKGPPEEIPPAAEQKCYEPRNESLWNTKGQEGPTQSLTSNNRVEKFFPRREPVLQPVTEYVYGSYTLLERQILEMKRKRHPPGPSKPINLPLGKENTLLNNYHFVTSFKNLVSNKLTYFFSEKPVV